MIVVFDKISSKVLYLIENNGKFIDINGVSYKTLNDNTLIDNNGRIYYVNNITQTDCSINNYVENNYICDYFE
jgi:hypothetical protein